MNRVGAGLGRSNYPGDDVKLAVNIVNIASYLISVRTTLFPSGPVHLRSMDGVTAVALMSLMNASVFHDRQRH